MKKFTLLITLILLSIISFGQVATFNWMPEMISEGNTLQGMTVSGDTSAIIIGYDNTFKKKNSVEQSWTDVNIIKPEYDFIGLGSDGETIIISSKMAKAVDHPSGGKSDIYVSGVLLKSNDWGETWSTLDVSKIGNGDDPSTNPNAEGSFKKNIYSVGVFNSDTFLVSVRWYDISSGSDEYQSSIFITNDGGENWNAVVSGLGSRVINTIEVMDSIAVFGGDSLLCITNIHTGTTIDIYPNLATITDGNVFVYSINIVNRDTFYLATTSEGIFKTTNGGETFTKFDGIDGGFNILPLNDSSLIVLGISSKSKITTDYGITWTDCYPGSTCWNIGGALGDTLYALAKTYAYKIAVSDLIQKNFNWKSIELNANDDLREMFIFNNNNAIIVGDSEMCKKTMDGGLTWTQSSLPENFNEDIDFNFKSISNNGNSALSTVRRYKIVDFPSDSQFNDLYMDGLVFKTTDNWETFSLLDISKIGANEGDDVTLNPQLDACYGLEPFTVESLNENTAYLYTAWLEKFTTGEEARRGRVFKTTDGGETWNGITQDMGASFINSIEFKGDTGYIGGVKVFLKTVDGGENFIDLYPKLLELNEGDSSITVNSFSIVDENEFYVITTSDGVFNTKDGGESFAKMEGVDGTNEMYLLDHNSFMLLGTTSKSYFTNDGGLNWQDPVIGKTIYSIGEIFNDSLYALGKGEVYRIAITDLDIKTYLPIITQEENLEIRYESDHVNIVSKNNKPIAQCLIYSINGQLTDIKQPYSNVCKLNNYDYKPGIYIVAVLVDGKKYADKILLK